MAAEAAVMPAAPMPAARTEAAMIICFFMVFSFAGSAPCQSHAKDRFWFLRCFFHPLTNSCMLCGLQAALKRQNHALKKQKKNGGKMNSDIQQRQEHLLQTGFDDLPSREQRVLKRIAKRIAISENINETFHERLTFGQRLADKVAAFGGSWTFINLFRVVLAFWVLINTLALLPWMF
ncbi:MAG: hypothetical protein R3D29_05900 [Nitratireductor sp.]